MRYTSTILLALAGAVGSAPIEERRATDFSSSEQNSSGCKAFMVVFARGTTEAGNVGTLSGPPFFQALAKMVGPENLSVQGVEYPADIPGFLAGGDAGGSAKMADLLKTTMTQCPQAKVITAGYSQGGQLTHNSAQMMGPAAGQLAGAVIFGDPNNGKAVQGVAAAKTKVICHQGDNICEGGDAILQPHLTYSLNADEAAQFVAGL